MKPPISLLAAAGDAGVPGDPSDRSALLAGLAFVEGVASGWTRTQLAEWLRDHLVAPGRMIRATVVREPPLAAISIQPRDAAAPAIEGLPRLLATARDRVVASMRALIGAPPDDRFLRAAIFGGRVQRRREGAGSVWVARPAEGDALGDVVLSLFAADVLMHRELHEARLCVCDVCGRISYQPAVTTRGGCPEHLPRSGTNSGFVLSKPRMPAAR